MKKIKEEVMEILPSIEELKSFRNKMQPQPSSVLMDVANAISEKYQNVKTDITLRIVDDKFCQYGLSLCFGDNDFWQPFISYHEYFMQEYPVSIYDFSGRYVASSNNLEEFQKSIINLIQEEKMKQYLLINLRICQSSQDQ